MSRGPGRIQRTIQSLIAGDEHGAWLVSDICKHVYPGIDGMEKKHQVAVNRALSSMTLPEPWEIRYSGTRGGSRVLYNTCDPESTARWDWLTKHDCSWDEYRERHLSTSREQEIDERVRDSRDHYELDELGRIEQRIAKTKANVAFLELAGMRGAVRNWANELRSLEKHRRELVARSRQGKT